MLWDTTKALQTQVDIEVGCVLSLASSYSSQTKSKRQKAARLDGGLVMLTGTLHSSTAVPGGLMRPGNQATSCDCPEE